MAYQITAACSGCSHCARWCPTGAISGRRKVRYTIDPQKCVECGACGRICTYQAVQMANGESAQRLRLSEWLKPSWAYDACNRCGDCIAACPANCLQLAAFDDPEKIRLAGYPFLPRVSLCIGCGFCYTACSHQAIALTALGVSSSQ